MPHHSDFDALDLIVQTMIEASIAAAQVINDVYARDVEAEQKADGSPVTEADSAAETVILSWLESTGLPVLAEESVAAGRIPSLGERYFVVDPLDGTKEFLKRNGEFTVNIALVEDGRPIAGVVLAPVTGRTHIGCSSGALVGEVSDEKLGPLSAISVAERHPPRVVASRSHRSIEVSALCSSLQITEDVSVGSSLKFCLLAEAAAELYPRLTPTCEWDTAAGQAVVEAAGGVVLTFDKQPLRYGKRQDDFYNPFFVAACSEELAAHAIDELNALRNSDVV
ncbi:3'(2'),5'-bisphosphate nucleotidase CysQ [Devosia pacifica]|uniref:3'(2'),5'-bisphosphate nucleotidase CysQ n=1 Tax=Devosia pacifica TaxID=1335967 RepID=A0A918VY05_9HYPH|nr:3'(2'),5'-bisphosphate nucleotidase CysQ [Devosia pacifica]GHA34376.1 3'(2'),5'-bisphosphate nucleotidase CysQ [Devosia pacifica]